MNPRHALVNGIEQSPMPVVCMAHLAELRNQIWDQCGRLLDILEVGSLYGESAAILATGGHHVWCVDLFEHGMGQFSLATTGLDVTPIRGNSVDVLPHLADRAFDLIFLDGDHRWPTVDSDITHARRLIRHGGIICGDDLERVLRSKDEYDVAVPFRWEDYRDGYHPGVSCAVYEQFGTDVSMRDRFWWVTCP